MITAPYLAPTLQRATRVTRQVYGGMAATDPAGAGGAADL